MSCFKNFLMSSMLLSFFMLDPLVRFPGISNPQVHLLLRTTSAFLYLVESFWMIAAIMTKAALTQVPH